MKLCSEPRNKYISKNLLNNKWSLIVFIIYIIIYILLIKTNIIYFTCSYCFASNKVIIQKNSTNLTDCKIELFKHVL